MQKKFSIITIKKKEDNPSFFYLKAASLRTTVFGINLKQLSIPLWFD